MDFNRSLKYLYLSSFIAFLISMQSSPVYGKKDFHEKQLKRQGIVIGLDPGLALRFNDEGTSLYARMNFRIGGCFNERVQLGMDLRLEIMAAGEADPSINRHEIGPVLTVFLKKGWFIRPHVHINSFNPFILASGLATGYEWSMGEFAGGGVSIGGDLHYGFTGEAPYAYATFISIYLTAYDLKNRRGRNDMELH